MSEGRGGGRYGFRRHLGTLPGDAVHAGIACLVAVALQPRAPQVGRSAVDPTEPVLAASPNVERLAYRDVVSARLA